jgi:hypothetical protein
MMFRLFLFSLLLGSACFAQSLDDGSLYDTNDMQIRSARVSYLAGLDLLVFSAQVKGQAGRTLPVANGELNGAPVLGYVFPTTLEPADVGFIADEGIVALALTSHPDFDDTPLWDEDNNGNYGDDGVEWHTHWVLLGPDDRVPGGLAVIQIQPELAAEVLPPTNPGMPMYMDSPGFGIAFSSRFLKILVPAQRVSGHIDFNYDAVGAFMRVDTTGEAPLLGVYAVYSVASGDLSLPYRVHFGNRL